MSLVKVEMLESKNFTVRDKGRLGKYVSKKTKNCFEKISMVK